MIRYFYCENSFNFVIDIDYIGINLAGDFKFGQLLVYNASTFELFIMLGIWLLQGFLGS